MYAAADRDATPIKALEQAANGLFDGFGWIAIFSLFIGLLSVMAINQYGGMMSMTSIVDSIKPVKPTRNIRIIGILVMFVLVWGAARFIGIERFNKFYGNVLIFLAYLFTPWTAINLVDYFFVRRGIYSTREIFNAQGIYGRWGWRGQTSYLVALVCMVPFMVTAPFTGSFAHELGDVDYSLFVGLPIAGILYWVLCRNLDLATERRLAQEEGHLSGMSEASQLHGQGGQ